MLVFQKLDCCCFRMYRSMQPMIDTSVVEEVPAKEPRFHLLPAKSSLKAKDRPQSAVIASNSSGGYSREVQPPKRCSFPKAFPGNSVVESNDSRTSNFIRYESYNFPPSLFCTDFLHCRAFPPITHATVILQTPTLSIYFGFWCCN